MRRVLVTALLDLSADPTMEQVTHAAHVARGSIEAWGAAGLSRPIACRVLYCAELAAPGTPPRPDPEPTGKPN